MSGIFYLAFCVAMPCAIAYDLCKKRHRNPMKGIVITGLAGIFGFGGWLVVFVMWLALKRRNPTTLVLY